MAALAHWKASGFIVVEIVDTTEIGTLPQQAVVVG